MSRKRRHQDDDGLDEAFAAFREGVKDSINYMHDLLDSKKPENHLKVFIIILAAAVIGLRLLLYFNGDNPYNILNIIILGLFLGGFGLILGKIYIKILDFFIKLGSNELNALRWVMTILLISIPLAIIATIYRLPTLGNITMWILAGQFPALFLGGIKLISDFTSYDAPIEKTSWNIWDALGKINTILGIIAAIITIGAFIFQYTDISIVAMSIFNTTS